MSWAKRATTSTSTIFPTYLLPSLPFRRKGSTDSTNSSPSTCSPTSEDPPPTPISTPCLTSHVSYIRCLRCAADLAPTSQIVSRGFTGRYGRAYLVAPPPTTTRPPSTLPNTHTLKAVPRQLVTGAHTVSDVICTGCGAGLGWKYVAAEEESQKYKVGKFILETKRVCTATRWDGGRGDDGFMEGRRARLDGAEVEVEVEFDSQDEDECEDLFLGTWTSDSALRRRRARKLA